MLSLTLINDVYTLILFACIYLLQTISYGHYGWKCNEKKDVFFILPLFYAVSDHPPDSSGIFRKSVIHLIKSEKKPVCNSLSFNQPDFPDSLTIPEFFNGEKNESENL